MSSPSLVVLAAGMGSRYGSTKQLDPFGPSSETILDYTLYDALLAGFTKVVFVIRKEIEKEFKKKFGTISTQISSHYVFQEINSLPEGLSLTIERKKPWGTAHAVLMTKPLINEPFVVVNADDFYGREAFQTIFKHLKNLDNSAHNACIIGYELQKTLSKYGKVARGICQMNHQHFLQNITERTDIYREDDSNIYYKENNKKHLLTGKESVSMNLIGFSSSVFELMEKQFMEFFEINSQSLTAELYIPNIIDQLCSQGVKIPVLPTATEWFGVTYKEDKITVINKLKTLVQLGIYPKKLWG